MTIQPPTPCGSLGKEACMKYDRIAEECGCQTTPYEFGTEGHVSELRDAIDSARRLAMAFTEDSSTRKILEDLIQAAQENEQLKALGLPEKKNIGDGFIFTGKKFLPVAPSMEAYAIISMDKEITRLKSDLAKAVTGLRAIGDWDEPISKLVARETLKQITRQEG